MRNDWKKIITGCNDNVTDEDSLNEGTQLIVSPASLTKYNVAKSSIENLLQLITNLHICFIIHNQDSK